MNRRPRGMLLARRALFSLCALLLTPGAAAAHHVPVSAEVPQWNGFLWCGLGLLVAVEVGLVVALRRRADTRRIEQAWMWVPLSVLLVLGVVRFTPFFRASVVLAATPADAPRVAVEARQWQWTFRYPDGRAVDNEVHLPAGRPVQLVLTSRDVLHSFEVPELGIRRDVSPSAPAVLCIAIPRPGRYRVFCGAVCGGPADEMAGVIAVDAPNEYTVFDRLHTPNTASRK